MNEINREPGFPPLRVLATDLDGTLIPLPDAPENLESLEVLRRVREQNAFVFLYATGRHLESVMEAVNSYNLPLPDWIVCDVGTTVCHRDGGVFHPFAPYQAHLRELIGKSDPDRIRSDLEGLEGLDLQIPAHQGEFKISFECGTALTDSLLEQVNGFLRDHKLPFEASGSVDPFRHCGLIDLLPTDVSKAYALNWLSTHADFGPEEVVYAGDSGNDLPALIGGFHSIVVANASEGLAEKVQNECRKRGWPDRCHIASATATSGVLEGCRAFGLI